MKDPKMMSTLLQTKWQRALKRHGYRLSKRIFANSTPVDIISTTPSGLLIRQPTLIVSYEVERIYSVIKSIALGLYYWESGYKEKWNHNCIIRSPNFSYPDLSQPEDIKLLIKINEYLTNLEYHPELIRLGWDKKGDYPEIFYYQFFKNQVDKLHTIRMVFYNYFVFFAFLGLDFQSAEKNLVKSIALG